MREDSQLFYKCLSCLKPAFQKHFQSYTSGSVYLCDPHISLFDDDLPSFLESYRLNDIFAKPMKFVRLLRGKIRLDLILIRIIVDKQGYAIEFSEYPLWYQMLMSNLADDDLVPINFMSSLDYRYHYVIKFLIDIYLDRKLSFDYIRHGDLNYLATVFDHLLFRNQLNISEWLLEHIRMEEQQRLESFDPDKFYNHYQPIITARKIVSVINHVPLLSRQVLTVFLQHWLYR